MTATPATAAQSVLLAKLWVENRALVGYAPTDADQRDEQAAIIRCMTKAEASREIDSFIAANRHVRAATRNGAQFINGREVA